MEQRPNHTVRLAAASAAMLLLGVGIAQAQTPAAPCMNGPPNQIWSYGMPYEGYPMPRPGITPGYAPPSQTTSADGMTTIVSTAKSLFPPSNPFDNPTNLLPTVYTNVYDSLCHQVPNTLTSTPEHPYNLHPAPVVAPVNITSPYDDLRAIIKSFHQHTDDDHEDADEGVHVDQAQVRRAIDILEGNPIPNRAYSGMPLLHYNGPAKYKQVQPIKDANGNVIGGNVVVHEIFYRSHIESDTSLLDVSQVENVPWTVTYIVDMLDQGADDFSPSTMYFDDPNAFGGAAAGPAAFKPLITEDLTFFPQQEGTRTTYQISMAPGRYFNGTYTWGWRVHPGRVQFMENQAKMILGDTLRNWEVKTFGPTPMADHASQVAAINMISNLSPAKRMWNAFNALAANGSGANAKALVAEIEAAFDDWDHRGRLPRGVTADPNADITLFYCNNTIYAAVKGYTDPNAHMEYTQWKMRAPDPGAHAKIKIINGDYYQRGYMSVDFGGMRGWENTFQNTIPLGGDGAWFSFGRFHWWPNVMAVPVPAAVPAAPLASRPVVPAASLVRDRAHEVRMAEDDPDGKGMAAQLPANFPNGNGDTLGVHWIDLTWNFEPSRRLRFYQFDPLHHDVAVFSMH